LYAIDRPDWVWWASGLQPPRIAVNVSAIQLMRRDFTDQVRALVAEAVSGETALDMEITESLLMQDIEGVIPKPQNPQTSNSLIALLAGSAIGIGRPSISNDFVESTPTA